MWIRLTVTADDGSQVECELGSDQPPYPDEAAEQVRRLLDLYRGAIQGGE